MLQGVMEWSFLLAQRVVALWLMAARDCSPCFSVESASSHVTSVGSEPMPMAILLIQEGLLLVHNSLLLYPINISFNSIS